MSVGESVSVERVSSLLGVMATNSLSLEGGGVQGLYPTLSLLSHSCVPSLEHWVDEGGEVVVRTKRPVDRGEELSFRYSPLSLHSSLLGEVIRQAWHFDCSCSRCEDPTELGTFASSPLCQECGTGPLVEGGRGEGWRCRECGHSEHLQTVVALARQMRAVELSYLGLEPGLIPGLVDRIEGMGGHQLHHSVIALKQQYVEEVCQAELDEATCKQVLSWGVDLMCYSTALDQGISRRRGRLLFCLAKVQAWILDHRSVDKQEMAKRRREILKTQLSAQKMISGFTM